ncbi:MAG: efflux RND transporter permease subunit, partial [Anaplasmataceae bacterium]|nr:efflux RND transporter permease subunit [Anaplasmataceae bacterium]
FLPLIAWPGVIGGFIKYLPITVTAVLLSSMICALIFNPVIGILFGKASTKDKKEVEKIIAIENAEIDKLSKPLKIYYNLLNLVLDHKGKFISLIVGSLVFTVILYSKLNHGMIFFPAMEPDILMVKIKSKEAQSLQEKNQLVTDVEEVILKINHDSKEFKSVYTNVIGNNVNGNIGRITLDLANWQKRRKAAIIQKEIIEKTNNIKGVLIKVVEEKKGPGAASPIDLRLTTYADYDTLIKTAEKIRDLIENDGHFKNVETNLGIPAMEWAIKVDKMRATERGISMQTIQKYISLATDKLTIGAFKPSNSPDDIDITVQFPKNYQSISAIKNLIIQTTNGGVPLSSIATIIPQRKNNEITQINSQLSISIVADMEGDAKVNDGIKIIENIIKENDFSNNINMEFKGEAADQLETQAFLGKAFIISLLLVFLIIAFQFNSYYYTFIIMSAIILSTTGVLLGLLIAGKPFTMVMCGIGIISLAGIVVNNNIILIEVYTILVKTMDRRQAIITACIGRIRPILITSGTTIIGLLPMAVGINIDLINRDITYGAPSGQMWTALATTISSGLTFATILTLFFTPAVLLYERKRKQKSIDEINKD